MDSTNTHSDAEGRAAARPNGLRRDGRRWVLIRKAKAQVGGRRAQLIEQAFAALRCNAVQHNHVCLTVQGGKVLAQGLSVEAVTVQEHQT